MYITFHQFSVFSHLYAFELNQTYKQVYHDTFNTEVCFVCFFLTNHLPSLNIFLDIWHTEIQLIQMYRV